ncbi:MAG: YhcH/YjgK/YiaL family protein [Clostridiales bacterium]|nr:YhcH/YjgK/YiaL family protein [Clostridiales bacterium]
MIFGNTKQFDAFAFLDEKLKKCLLYATTQDLHTAKPGRYEIDGESIYMNLEEFTTMSAEGRDYEAHRRYLDLFYVVEGAEQVDFNFIENMKQIDYDAQKDRASFEGESAGSVILRAGDFLICYPNDAHRPAVCVGEPRKIKKAVFKVRI